MATFWQDHAVVAELLQRQADVDRKDNKGRTTLHQAARYSDVATMKLLLKHTKSIDSQDHQGWTPLQIACHPESSWNQNSQNLSIIQMLLERGARSFSIRNNRGYSAHDIAVHYQNRSAAILMRELSCDAPGPRKNPVQASLAFVTKGFKW
jgi:ankyrin repeat protein